MVQSANPTIGKYALVERLERAGPGEVYRAQHRRQQVAIRLLTGSPADDPAFTARFEREMARLAALDHPRIAPILAFGQQDGVPYVVTPLLPAERLADRFARNRPAAAELPDLLRPVAEALDYAHALGITHGDLRASNVFIDLDGLPVIDDFGLHALDADDTAVSPTRPDQRADIAALARIAYLGLTGRALETAEPPGGPAGLAPLRKALAPAGDAYTSAGEFVRDFAAALGSPAGAPRVAARPAAGDNAPGATAVPPSPPPARRGGQALLPSSPAARRIATLWVGGIVLVAFLLGAAYLALGGRDNGKASSIAVPQPTQAAASAAPVARGAAGDLPYRFPVDNALIARRYAEAQGRLPREARDARLHRFAAECYEPRTGDDCLLVYVFYSKQTDLMYNYHFKVLEADPVGDFTEPAQNDDYRIVMSALPWEKNPGWARLLQESYAQLPENFAPAGFTAALVSNSAALNSGSADWTMVYVDRARGAQHIFELLGDHVTKLPE